MSLQSLGNIEEEREIHVGLTAGVSTCAYLGRLLHRKMSPSYNIAPNCCTT